MKLIFQHVSVEIEPWGEITFEVRGNWEDEGTRVYISAAEARVLAKTLKEAAREAEEKRNAR